MKWTPKWTTLLTVLGVFLLVAVGNRGLWNLLHLAHEKSQLTRDTEKLRTDIASLQAQYHEYGSRPETLERLAREELDLIKPGEIIYKFNPSQR